MIIASNIQKFQSVRSSFAQDKKVGFVPTMGTLHSGHISLIKKAQLENDLVIVSIFVNPTQFNSKYDFQTYPNHLQQDIEILESLRVDILFNPNQKDIYPDGDSLKIQPNVEIASILEGKARPGHFSGMLTVILKLLQITKPNNIYFGEKDYQQLILVKQLVKDFFIDTKVIGCPTTREDFGLPLSSRNKNLTNSNTQITKEIYNILKQDNFSDLKSLSNKIGATEAKLEYIKEMDKRIFLAFYVGKVRLIDNFLKKTGPSC
ncbi:pantothenate synthetase [Francisella halioticida]|uniref:Pantothenate synthetase n=1 Tax=Francisella halioticida TaxID=549298 RepID=A0ABN5AWI2_9GAMM|nr:pantoate--beta-alanine ligase [Francisella halioticida]ASG67835.1 pantoate--beta-alanine ligase [Francisella halioticida]BCD90694.1 pantothenate synthetase [Francisella halioticida]